MLEPGDLVVLGGELGAGKTVFTKGIADGLDVAETVVSPTFTLAREYMGRLRLVHVDVYRLDRVQEFLDLGLEDLAGDDAVTVVEWGDVVAAELHARSPRRATHAVGTGGCRGRRPGSHARTHGTIGTLALRPRGASWNRRADRLRAQLSESPRC